MHTLCLSRLDFLVYLLHRELLLAVFLISIWCPFENSPRLYIEYDNFVPTDKITWYMRAVVQGYTLLNIFAIWGMENHPVIKCKHNIFPRFYPSARRFPYDYIDWDNFALRSLR